MSLVDWVLELALLAALGATAFHAVRLERALRALRADRAAVGELVAGFDDSARTAGQGLERLRGATESAGREIARHVERAAALKDDLGYLTERGNRLADRMDALVRANRPADASPYLPDGRLHDDQLAAAGAERHAAAPYVAPRPAPRPAAPPEPGPGAAPLRSQAERDLLKALGVVR